jgi:nucleotide-binding universal stress UspA family protein
VFENVLVGVDGSASGRAAIALASALTETGGRITLAHVHGGLLRPTAAVTPGLAGDEALTSMALLWRERAATGVAAGLVSITATSPARGLHEQAARTGADLIVVGATGRARRAACTSRPRVRAPI